MRPRGAGELRGHRQQAALKDQRFRGLCGNAAARRRRATGSSPTGALKDQRFRGLCAFALMALNSRAREAEPERRAPPADRPNQPA